MQKLTSVGRCFRGMRYKAAASLAAIENVGDGFVSEGVGVCVGVEFRWARVQLEERNLEARDWASSN